MTASKLSPGLVVLFTVAACGSAGGHGTGFQGSSGAGDTNGSSGASAGGAASGGGASSGATGDGGVLLSLGGGGDAGANAQPCSTPGATQTCFCVGTKTCVSAGEFPHFAPCVDATGAVITSCPVPKHVCAPNETGAGCDAGTDAPPSPPPPPPPPPVCVDMTVNTEPGILVGYEPASGQTVGKTGQIKVWVSDENPPFIAPGEVVDNTTGAITTPGNRTALAADGLPYEPALYIAPQSPTNGGTPHFPQWVKGSYNNNPPTRGTFTGGAPIDPVPPATGLGGLLNFGAAYTGEFIWDVSSLGLAPGSYSAVFSVHDGDRDRAIGCVTIVIGP